MMTSFCMSWMIIAQRQGSRVRFCADDAARSALLEDEGVPAIFEAGFVSDGLHARVIDLYSF